MGWHTFAMDGIHGEVVRSRWRADSSGNDTRLVLELAEVG